MAYNKLHTLVAGALQPEPQAENDNDRSLWFAANKLKLESSRYERVKFDFFSSLTFLR